MYFIILINSMDVTVDDVYLTQPAETGSVLMEMLYNTLISVLSISSSLLNFYCLPNGLS